MRARDPRREEEFRRLLREVAEGGRKARVARATLREFPIHLTIQYGDVVDSFECTGWAL